MNPSMKPMLACKADLKRLQYPVYGSPKIDGIRAIVDNDTVLSRTLKPIPNKFVQQIMSDLGLHGFDGELVVGPVCGKDVMQRTTSGVMSVEGSPDFTYYVFDLWDIPDTGWYERYWKLCKIAENQEFNLNLRVCVLPQTRLDNLDDVLEFEEKCLKKKYEGIMLRSEDGPYKYGRSTVKEGYLLKLKRFADSEAIIIECIEQLHNDNEATVDERGYTKRSSHKENKHPTGMLGAFHVKDTKTGVEFDIGTGFTNQQREVFWQRQDDLIGQVLTYKHFENSGVKEAPRFPVFKGFRSRFDIEL
jgi:DNA ligase-1